jgi:hypothetical protein
MRPAPVNKFDLISQFCAALHIKNVSEVRESAMESLEISMARSRHELVWRWQIGGA